MKKTNRTPNKSTADAGNPAGTVAFKGFDDWIELFRAGHQVDSAGRGREWTEAELDQIVQNHSDETAAPIVIGHPKTDAPAYGWAQTLKREGKKLLGKFAQVEPTFADLVKEGRYRRRSVAIGEDPDKGFYLRHVGWLGAAAPAIKGLADVQFSEDATTTLHEFSYEQAAHMNALARLFRGVREALLERFGAEAADKAVPEWELESLNRNAAREEVQADNESQPVAGFAGMYNHPSLTPQNNPNQPQEENPVAEFTQEDLDAAVDRARQEERNAQEGEKNQFRERVQQLEAEQARRDAEREVSALVDAGKVLPSQMDGMTEFVAALDGEASLEFTAGDDTQKTNPREWFLRTFMANQPKVVPLGKQREDADPVGADDYEALGRKASEFQEAQRKAGRDVTFTEAWEHVKKEASQ